MSRKDIGIAAAICGLVLSAFLSPPDVITTVVYAVIGIATTVGVGLAIRRLESSKNSLPQDQHARVAACATLGLITAVVLLGLLQLVSTKPG